MLLTYYQNCLIDSIEIYCVYSFYNGKTKQEWIIRARTVSELKHQKSRPLAAKIHRYIRNV